MRGFGLPILLLSPLLATVGCRSLLPSDIPGEPDYVVAVKAVRIPRHDPLLAQTAMHVFVDFKKGSEYRWRRIEIFNRHSGVVAETLGWWEPRSDERWDRDVKVLKMWTGAEAKKLIVGLEVQALQYPADGIYVPWPGPNSNTFLAWLTRHVEGFHFEFDHNAAGKDYTPTFRSGETPSHTGVQVDTPVLGFAVGFAEGIEIHLLQLTFGISFRNPALKIPALPRLGFPIR